ncbi:hypothetical protein ABW19_dt0203151 [Dactylella cylindrospora]|nr:hypothetical protein ABW19_dt0203151 [Dactylella cylindrospora]
MLFGANHNASIGNYGYQYAEQTCDYWGFWELVTAMTVKDFLSTAVAEAVMPALKMELQGRPQAPTIDIALDHLLSSIFLHEFPSRISSWIDKVYQPDELREATSKLLGLPWVSTESYPPDIPRHHPRTPHLFLETLQAGIGMKDAWPEARKLKPRRLCRPGKRVMVIPELSGPHSWIDKRDFVAPFDKIDIHACVWDDWRLEEWGYEFPESPEPSEGS